MWSIQSMEIRTCRGGGGGGGGHPVGTEQDRLAGLALPYIHPKRAPCHRHEPAEQVGGEGEQDGEKMRGCGGGRAFIRVSSARPPPVSS